MEWMHEKYLRNQELEKVETFYWANNCLDACGLRCALPEYPVRSQDNLPFIPAPGFHRHPNESQEM